MTPRIVWYLVGWCITVGGCSVWSYGVTVSCVDKPVAPPRVCCVENQWHLHVTVAYYAVHLVQKINLSNDLSNTKNH